MVLRHKGYGVYVTCDGRSLEEFDFQVENDTTVSCYIASEQGKVCDILFATLHPNSNYPLGLCGTLGRRHVAGKRFANKRRAV